MADSSVSDDDSRCARAPGHTHTHKRACARCRGYQDLPQDNTSFIRVQTFREIKQPYDFFSQDNGLATRIISPVYTVAYTGLIIGDILP